MLRSLFTTIAITFLSITALAQDTTDYVGEPTAPSHTHSLKDRIWFGGGIGLNFGTVTAVQVDPLLGIYLDKGQRLTTGIGLSYYYVKYNVPGYLETNFSGYGYRVFSRYKVIEQAYLHAEFYHLNVQRYAFNDQVVRIWVPHVLVGGGYREPVGANSSFYLQVLWEVLQDPNSVYRGQGPIISGGVGIGF